MNKKGFTLVELLAVIVILAVVMLIAVTSVGPMMEKSRKNSLGTEGLAAMKAAETAFQGEQMKGTNAQFKSTEDVCFSLEYLCKEGYFEKGCDPDSDNYLGSVLADYTAGTGGQAGTVTYKFWITNGTYVFTAADSSNYGDLERVTKDYDEPTDKDVITTCGGSYTAL